MAPMAAPSANGVKTDDSPKTMSISRWSSGPFDAPCSAYAVPRRISPIAARNSGTTSVIDTAANTLGYAVHSTVSTKISQTWLASHTGPIDAYTRPRRWWSRVVSCQMPVPRSAPARTV
jgi:hypothetical protein